MNLHTDLLEKKYGPVRAVIVQQPRNRRIVDIVDRDGVTRTRAITFFAHYHWTDDRAQIRFATAAEKIKQGGLIGQVLSEFGFQLHKEMLQKMVVRLPKSLQQKFQVDDRFAVGRIYKLLLAFGPEKNFFYGMVCEIDSPDFDPVTVFGKNFYSIKKILTQLKNNLELVKK